MTKPYILVVDDEPDIRQLVGEILDDEGYQVAAAENAAQARQLYVRRRPDLVLLDIWMPDTDGITLLKEWLTERRADFPVIMMSGHGTVETAVEATRLGAYDFLEKPLSMAKLLLTVERALEAFRLHRENIGLRRRLDIDVEPIGRSAAMEQLRGQIKRLAQHEACLLLTGEAGSGKETFARYLHAHSAYGKGPFIDLDAGAANQSVGANAFFALLEQAQGGTLFLDEVAELNADVQQQMIRLLETRALPAMDGKPTLPLDMRIVAATRKSLEQEVRAGHFHKELYYLLNVVSLDIPPLRQHAEDVPELLNFYTDYFVTREKLPFRRFPVAVQNLLRNLPWHGNVRELKNLVQRLLILGNGEEIALEEVKTALGRDAAQASPLPPPPPGQNLFDLPLKDARDQFEKAYLQHHLDKNGGSIARLSHAIGMERTHLYRKLHALDIKFREKS